MSLEYRPALEVIADYGRHRNVLLYVDPAVPGRARRTSVNYRHQMAAEAEHRELRWHCMRNRRTEGVYSNRPLGTALCLFEDDLQTGDTDDSPAARTG